MKTRSIISNIILYLFIIQATGIAAKAQGPNADVKALFSKVAAAYRNFNSVSMSVVITVRDKGNSRSLNTRLHIQKPNKLYADISADKQGMTLVADGANIYGVSHSDSKHYRKEKDSGYTSIVHALLSAGGCGIGQLYVLLTDPAAENKMIQGTPQYVRRRPDAIVSGDKCDVVEIQTTAGNQPLHYSYAFAKSDHLLRRLSLGPGTESSSAGIVETYSAVRVNQTPNGGLFKFTPAKGAVAVNPHAPAPTRDAQFKVGSTPTPITGKDLSGKPVSLSQYKGKVVLLDFWATWCGPCIAELPNVVAAYSKYHARGFDVVGITLDQENSRAKVESFIAQNRMPWRQIYDGKYWSADNAVAYNVHGIPFTLLIGKDGKIAAVGARGPALAPAIEAALGRN